MSPGKRGQAVPRPTKKNEYELVFATREAAQGWTDCLATVRNAMVDAYDRLSTHPEVETERQYRLQADYATGTHNGVTYDRWQYKISSAGRLWYFIDATPTTRSAGRVLIERAEPGHPKETDRTGSAR